MTGTLALMIRSLRVDVRLMRTHLFRLLFVVMIYIMLCFAQQSAMLIGAPGLRFFSGISSLNVFMTALAGVSFFCTTITEEKEEATLGLLKMAGVSPLAMLLGKSAPRLISAFFLLSIQFPFTILSITLGGVTWHQVIATYWSLIANLALVANVGLFFSVCSKRSSGASWKMAVLLVGFYLIVPWIMLVLMFSRTGAGGSLVATVVGWIHSFSVLSRLDTILTTGFAESAFGFQVISNFAVAGVFFLLSWLSWLTFNTFTRNEGAVAAPSRGLLFRPIAAAGSRVDRRVWDNALAWKDFHFQTGGVTAFFVKLAAYPAPIIVIALFLSDEISMSTDHDVLGGLIMTVALLGFVIEASWLASGIFQREIKWNTLSSVMLLPMSTARFAYSKLAGSLLGLIPVTFVFLIGAIVSPTVFSDIMKSTFGDPEGYTLVLLFGFFIHLVAFLSLYVKWGALPLAIAMMVFCFMLIGACAISMSSPGPNGDGTAVFFSLLEIGGMIALQFAIGNRLRALAAK